MSNHITWDFVFVSYYIHNIIMLLYYISVKMKEIIREMS